MENKYEVLLFDKLEKNYADFMAEWSAMSPSELIDKSEEIYATQLVREHFKESLDEQQAEWLLRFQNPLEIMRDKWIEENGLETVHDEELSHAVCEVMEDSRDVENFYDLDAKAQTAPDRNGPVTVREFIEQHPGLPFDMMTPGGYVYLIPEKAKLLLSGQNVWGHPGNPEYAMEIPAEELLNQEVIRANFKGNVWYVLSNVIPDMEQKPPSSEQGMKLC